MWRVISAVMLMASPHHHSCFNTNRQLYYLNEAPGCDYYDNPLFKTSPETSAAQPAVFIDNRIRKEGSPFYNMFQEPTSLAAKQPKPLNSYFPNMTPANPMDLRPPHFESREDEEEEVAIDYDKVWQIGEAPKMRLVQALPDVYANHEDTPPAVDPIPVEISELTQETFDIGNAEIQEKYLNDPNNCEVQEILIETVHIRPESSSAPEPDTELLNNASNLEGESPENQPQTEVLQAVDVQTDYAIAEPPSPVAVEEGEDPKHLDSALAGIMQTM